MKYVFYFLTIWCLLFSNPLFSSKVTPAKTIRGLDEDEPSSSAAAPAAKPPSDVKKAAEPVKGLDKPISEHVTIIVKSLIPDPDNPLKPLAATEIERKVFPRIYLQHSEFLKAGSEGEAKEREYDLNKQYMQISLNDLFEILKVLTEQAQNISKSEQKVKDQEKKIREEFGGIIEALKGSEKKEDMELAIKHENELFEKLHQLSSGLDEYKESIESLTESRIRAIADKNPRAFANTFAYLGIGAIKEVSADSIIQGLKNNRLSSDYASKAKALRNLNPNVLKKIRPEIIKLLDKDKIVQWNWLLKQLLPVQPADEFRVVTLDKHFQLPRQSTIIAYRTKAFSHIEIVNILTREKIVFSLPPKMRGEYSLSNSIFNYQVSNDGSKIVVWGSFGELLEVWDVVSKRQLFTYDFKWSNAAWSPDDSFVAVVPDNPDAIHIYDVKSGKRISKLPITGKSRTPTIILWGPDNARILVECEIFSVQDGKNLFDLEGCHFYDAPTISWAANGYLSGLNSEYVHTGATGSLSSVKVMLNILNSEGKKISRQFFKDQSIAESIDQRSFWAPNGSILGVLGKSIKLFHAQGIVEIGEFRPPIPAEGRWALWQDPNTLISAHLKPDGVIFYYWNMKRFMNAIQQSPQIQKEINEMFERGSLDQLWLLTKMYHLSYLPLTFTRDEQDIVNTFPPTLKSLLMSLGKDDKELQEKQRIEVRPPAGARDTKHTRERFPAATAAAQQDPRAAIATPANALAKPVLKPKPAPAAAPMPTAVARPLSAAMRPSPAPLAPPQDPRAATATPAKPAPPVVAPAAARPASRSASAIARPPSAAAARPPLAAPKMTIAQAKAQFWSPTHEIIATGLKNPSNIKASDLKNWAAKIRAAQKTHIGFSLAAPNKERKTLEQLLADADNKHQFSSKFAAEWNILKKLFAE